MKIRPYQRMINEQGPRNENALCHWKRIATKKVPNGEGELVNYYWFQNQLTNMHAFVYDKSDLPYGEGYWDWCVEGEDNVNSIKQALEWFDSYTGLEDCDESYKRSSKINEDDSVIKINQPMRKSYDNEPILCYANGTPVKKGDVITDFRGDKAIVSGWDAPRCQGKSGYVYVKENPNDVMGRSYYVNVYNLHWENLHWQNESLKSVKSRMNEAFAMHKGVAIKEVEECTWADDFGYKFVVPALRSHENPCDNYFYTLNDAKKAIDDFVKYNKTAEKELRPEYAIQGQRINTEKEKNRFTSRSSIEKGAYPWYVVHYEGGAIWEPAEGGYYVDVNNAVESVGFQTRPQAEKYAKQWAAKLGLKKDTRDSFNSEYSPYIGDHESIMVESSKEYLQDIVHYYGYS